MSTKKSTNQESAISTPIVKTIKFINRNDKLKSMIIDCFRILAWQEFKVEYNAKGLEGYEEFKSIWLTHEIHTMNLNQLQELYSSLDYSYSDLVKMRNDYYAARRESKTLLEESVNSSIEDLAF